MTPELMDAAGTSPLRKTLETTTMELNFGPQHPATHGVYRAILQLDGERVVAIESVLGYLHRGIEKWVEYRTYTKATPIFDRLDYVGAILNCHGYVGAVEKLMKIQVSKRAQYIRVVLDELQRIANHLLWLGTHALDLGAMTVLFYGLREREVIMDLFEAMVGQRLLQNAYPIGGVRLDFPRGWERACRNFMAELPNRLDEYETLLSSNRMWLQRTKGIGIIGGAEAVALGLSGPTLRGSGVYFDVRKCIPYGSYEDFDFEVPLGENGDVYDRYIVRVREMRQSLRILQQALDGMPEGPLMPEKLSKIIRPPAGEAYFSVEGAKGQLGYYLVSDGTDKPWKCHVRSPSFINLQGLEKMVVGGLVADVVANIGSLDIVLGEVDR